MKLLQAETNTKSVISANCKNSHLFKYMIPRIAAIMFNGCAKNLVVSYNSTIHTARKRGLTSNNEKSHEIPEKRLN